jgi:hypothetical protein
MALVADPTFQDPIVPSDSPATLPLGKVTPSTAVDKIASDQSVIPLIEV